LILFTRRNDYNLNISNIARCEIGKMKIRLLKIEKNTTRTNIIIIIIMN